MIFVGTGIYIVIGIVFAIINFINKLYRVFKRKLKKDTK